MPFLAQVLAVVHEVFCFGIVEESMASEETGNVDIFQLDEQEHGDQDANAKDIAALVDQIHERCEANQFPMILPGEVCSSQQHFAKETLNLLDKTETVELQSFIESQYVQFRADSPADDDEPEGVRRAKWARLGYYVVARKYLVQKSMLSKQLAHRFAGEVFVPLLSPSSISNQEAQKLDLAVYPSVQEDDLPIVNAKFFEVWNAMVPVIESMNQDLANGFEMLLNQVLGSTPTNRRGTRLSRPGRKCAVGNHCFYS